MAVNTSSRDDVAYRSVVSAVSQKDSALALP